MPTTSDLRDKIKRLKKLRSLQPDPNHRQALTSQILTIHSQLQPSSTTTSSTTSSSPLVMRSNTQYTTPSASRGNHYNSNNPASSSTRYNNYNSSASSSQNRSYAHSSHSRSNSSGNQHHYPSSSSSYTNTRREQTARNNPRHTLNASSLHQSSSTLNSNNPSANPLSASSSRAHNTATRRNSAHHNPSSSSSYNSSHRRDRDRHSAPNNSSNPRNNYSHPQRGRDRDRDRERIPRHHTNPHPPHPRTQRDSERHRERAYTHSHPPRDRHPERHSKPPSLSRANTAHPASHPHPRRAPVPVVRLIDDSHSRSVPHSQHSQPSKPAENALQDTMSKLNFDVEPFKYDYKSKINLTLLAAQRGVERNKFEMDPSEVYEWQYTTETEKQTHVRDYLLPCLKLVNNLMCMDEAIDFLCAPNSPQHNPDSWHLFKSRIDDENGRNMCLEWVANLLKSDYYETVDDFANDVRLIWNNAFSVFGMNHEWSQNAVVLQQEFEQQMIRISRHIPNAESIFTQNGNPRIDPLQQECINSEENQKRIAESLEKLRKENKLHPQPPVAIDGNHQQHGSKLDSNHNGNHNKQSRSSPPTQPQQQTAKSDIYRPNRRRQRPTKQTLKSKPNPPPRTMTAPVRSSNNDDLCKLGVSTEATEEGEIKEKLTSNQLFEVGAWYQFVEQFGQSDCIRAVLMVQEGFTAMSDFVKYQQNKSITLNMEIVGGGASADSQWKIYNILQRTVQRLTVKNPLAQKTLRCIIDERKRNPNATQPATSSSANTSNGNNRQRVLDPYSKEAVQLREREEAEKRRKEAARLQKQNGEAMDEDSDEDDFVDDIHAYTAKPVLSTTRTQPVMGHRKKSDNIIGKDEYGGNSMRYQRIKPSNIIEDDVNVDAWCKDSHSASMSVDNEYKSNSPSRVHRDRVRDDRARIAAQPVVQNTQSNSPSNEEQWHKMSYTQTKQGEEEQDDDEGVPDF